MEEEFKKQFGNLENVFLSKVDRYIEYRDNQRSVDDKDISNKLGTVRSKGWGRVVVNFMIDSNQYVPLVLYGYFEIKYGQIDAHIIYGAGDFPDYSEATFGIENCSIYWFRGYEEFKRRAISIEAQRREMIFDYCYTAIMIGYKGEKGKVDDVHKKWRDSVNISKPGDSKEMSEKYANLLMNIINKAFDDGNTMRNDEIIELFQRQVTEEKK